MNKVILLNAILDLGIVLAVAVTMLVPFTLDRRKDDARQARLMPGLSRVPTPRR